MKTTALFSFVVTLTGCLGGYAPGTPGTSTPPSGGSSSNGNNGNTGSSGSSGSSGSTSGSPSPTPKTLFDANVAPILTTKCAATVCHGGTGTNPPPFAAGAATGLYTTVLNYGDILLGGFDKTKAQILLKIAPGNHNGAIYSSTDVGNIDGWLDAELAANTKGSTPSPRDALLAKWSGCMTQSDFDAAGVATAWAQKRTDTSNTACEQCHTNADGFLANSDSTRMFNILTTAANPLGGWYLEYLFTVDTTDPNNLKVVLNRDYINRAATGTGQHELFQVDTDRGGGTPSAYQRLTTFLTSTQQHLTAGTCGAPRLGTPTP
jgi:hypothetical protein